MFTNEVINNNNFHVTFVRILEINEKHEKLMKGGLRGRICT